MGGQEVDVLARAAAILERGSSWARAAASASRSAILLSGAR